MSVFHLLGLNLNVRSDEVTVWRGPGRYPFPETANRIRVRGNDPADAPGGAGAFGVLVEGLDDALEPISEVLLTAGDGGGPWSSQKFYRVLRASVTGVGTKRGANIGTLKVKEQNTTNPLAVIGAGEGIALQSVYTVPKGKVLSLLTTALDATEPDAVDLRFYGRAPDGEIVSAPYPPTIRGSTIVGVKGSVERVWSTGFAFPEGWDLELTAQNGGAGTKVSASIAMRLA